ncbi:MFS general substrate transporter [Sistotremastrum niveocremeum HHB9708]|uniref:MFS general substrate transporter n=1 Tax=Sistotremastrum niveocremeum HHB9708 TaxID=1314777 RepID=A0A164UJ96_9AGAM|nr:MFS general substrate transporter [Sistotremastrum niveocremeum HHB9708]
MNSTNVNEKEVVSMESVSRLVLKSTTGKDASILTSLPQLYIDKSSPTISGYTDSPVSVHYHSDKQPFDSLKIPPYDDCGTITRKCSPSNFDSLQVEAELRVRKLDKIRLAAGSYAYFVCGWGDGVTGTVLPYFDADYHLSYTLSSIVFVAATVGFFIGTFLLESVIKYLGKFDVSKSKARRVPMLPSFLSRVLGAGKGKELGFSEAQALHFSLVWSAFMLSLFFVIVGLKGGAPTLFFAYSVAAFARAFLTGQLNAFATSRPGSPIAQLHGFWGDINSHLILFPLTDLKGIGACISPIVCQTLVAKGVPWPNFYLGSIVVGVLNVIFLGTVFRVTGPELERDKRAALLRASLSSVSDGKRVLDCEASVPSPSPRHNDQGPDNVLASALKNPLIWAYALFLCLYSGLETTTQGYMVIYLLSTKDANTKTAGYTTSAFWAGMAITRIFSSIYFRRLDTHRIKTILHGLIIYPSWLPQPCSLSIAVTAIAVHLAIWFTPSVVANMACTGVIGLLYGPLFPIVCLLSTKFLPSKFHMIAMGLMSSFASLGSSLFPFMTGAISNAESPRVLPYILVGLTGGLAFFWTFFPSRVRGTVQMI